jgi:hypothetical protein
MEGGEVARACGVQTARTPLPDQLIRHSGEGDLLQPPPEHQVLSYLVHTYDAMDVTGPAVCVQPLGNSAHLAPSLGNASVELRSYFSDGH